ncbi:MAG: DUF1830 domain-containing protein [Elainellaceae cyanobacterium]
MTNVEMFRNDEKVRYFLCCYYNASDEAVVLRIMRTGDATLEQSISPREQLLFSAADGETVEVYTVQNGVETFLETMSCAQLRHVPGETL